MTVTKLSGAYNFGGLLLASLITMLATFFLASVCYSEAQPIDSLSICIGQPVPLIEFNEVLNSAEEKFSTRDLNGKPTVLYFFSTACKSSFAHFREIEKMYAMHRERFRLIMVAIDLDDNIRAIYEQYRLEYQLDFPVVFDKIVYKRYRIRAVPNVVWINSAGVVQAITNMLDAGYLNEFVNGRTFQFISYSDQGRSELRSFNPEEPFLINGNGGQDSDFIQRSVLSEWKIGMPEDMPWARANQDPLKDVKYLQAIGRELADLYRIAFFGKTYAWHSGDSAYGNYHFSPILAIKDRSKFDADYNLGKNLFCYSQVLPPERRNPKQMLQVMQRDLKNFFSYEVNVETRMMPYLSLVATDDAKNALATHGGAGKKTSSLVHIHFINQPIAELIGLISYNLDLVRRDLPLMDDTQIKGNIDIRLDAILTDFEKVKSELARQGLKVVQKAKPMNVIVIKDADE